MNIEAEIKAAEAAQNAHSALLILLVRQLAQSGVLDAPMLADRLTNQADQTLRDIRKRPQPDDDLMTLAAQNLRVLSRQILNLPEPPEFRPTVVASRHDDP